nr:MULTISPECIES: endonuclease/exonuclease/phosphatase family protein [unclassified Spirosoma]
MRTRVGQLISFFFRSLLWSINLMLALYTCLAYWLLYSLQIEHWSAGMIMISIPIAWGLNFVVVCLWLTSRPWRSWLSGVVLILGIALFGSRTFVWHSPAKPTDQGTPIKVFSYNVHQFNEFGTGDNPVINSNGVLAQRMLNFVLRFDAPIKCFQETYTQGNLPEYDLLSRFSQAGYPYSALLHPEEGHKPNGDIGVSIFSRFPIVDSGQEVFETHNGLVWANIKVGDDTIRVINVHLHSMGIRVGRVLRQNEMKGVQHETRGVLSALRMGFIDRNKEVRRVEEYIRASPYPVIVTGDHNDTPYSVVYERMRRVLPNSFEDAGRGFGFTYNRLPKFIRIDHQFHDPNLSVVNFETINYTTYSDHYPIVGTYYFKDGHSPTARHP